MRLARAVAVNMTNIDVMEFQQVATDQQTPVTLQVFVFGAEQDGFASYGDFEKLAHAIQE
jgi:hypothetical protein